MSYLEFDGDRMKAALARALEGVLAGISAGVVLASAQAGVPNTLSLGLMFVLIGLVTVTNYEILDWSPEYSSSE